MAEPIFPRSQASDVAEPAAVRRAAKSPTRWLLPFAILIVIIGGIAWLVQFMPTWHARKALANKSEGREPMLNFAFPAYLPVPGIALWEPPVPPQDNKPPKIYVREFERQAEGLYYFPFQVLSRDEFIQVNLEHQSCDCAKVHVAFSTEARVHEFFKNMYTDPAPADLDSLAWQPLELHKAGVSFPPAAFGFVKVSWSNRRMPPESLNLKMRLAARLGATQREDYPFMIPAVSTHALRVERDRAEVGLLAGGLSKAEFVFWSPTRDHAVLKLNEQDAKDPLFDVKITPLDAKQRADLQASLRKADVNTRVRTGWRVLVNVNEEKAGQRLSDGHFRKPLSLQIPDAVEDIPPVIVSGYVKGPIEIGGVDDRGKINLKSFSAQDGASKATFLWADPRTELVVEAKRPDGLEVKLTPTKEATATKRKWVLEVVVPPNLFFGTIGDENAIILRTTTTPPRSIRIPLVGHAVQG